MNRQTIMGIVLIGVILFGFSWYQNKQAKEQAVQTVVEQTVAVEGQTPTPAAAESFASGEDPLGGTLGVSRGGEGETFTVENDVMRLEFSTKGGILSGATLNEYRKFGTDEPVHLWKPGSQKFDVEFFIKNQGRDAQLNTSGFVFGHEVIEEGDFTKVAMRLPVDSLGGHVEFLYTVPRNEYMIDLDVRFVDMAGVLSNQSSFEIDWANTGLHNERGFDNENNYTTIAYRYPEVKDVEDLGIARAGASKAETENSRVQWVGFKQQFFMSALIADNAFSSAEMSYSTHQPTDGEIKDFSANLIVPMEGGQSDYGFRMYLGPNKFSVMKGYGLEMERTIAMGWMSFGWISRGALIPLFEWLSSWGIGIGLVIFLMTLIIKIVIAPLTFTSYLSSAKMRVIKPEVDELSKKYPDQADALKKQQAQMELYKKAGINPLAGCIPMLIQFPIIIAMFRFFPAAIELRGKSLWWAEDLSSYDSVANLGVNVPFYGDHVSLFALLMAVSMYFYSVINFKQQAAQPQMAGMKFMMLYAMPVMMLFWFNSYSSGLCYYYLLGNLLNMLQMWGAKWFINEDKLRAKMMARPVKAKKKSGFMARLEEAQKAQLAQQQAQRQQGKKK